jgi:pyrroloquinoline quinone (PQQ) biosynthesis protein C
MLKRHALSGDLIQQIGTVLYGTQWQRQMARALGVSEMTIRRWRFSESTMPDAAVEDIKNLLVEQRHKVTSTHQRLLSELGEAA